MPTDAELNAWSTAVGLAPCIGAEFAAERQGRLPSLPELCPWATSTGRRSADGTWACLGSTTTPATTPEETPAAEILAGIRDAMASRPGYAVGLALAIWLFLSSKQKHHRRMP